MNLTDIIIFPPKNSIDLVITSFSGILLATIIVQCKSDVVTALVIICLCELAVVWCVCVCVGACLSKKMCSFYVPH